MATAVLHAHTYESAKKGTSLLDKILNTYRENPAIIICGVLSMTGTSNIYPLYKMLTETTGTEE